MQIELREVRAARGTQPVLRGVSLALAGGERLALLGPSGSGKSTLLLALAGLHPCEGDILLDGRSARGLDPRQRGMGMVFQDLALWPHMSVEGHLRFVLGGSRAQQDRIREILALVELSALAGRLPSQLSGGEAQRLALARALIGRPRALLLDEPFGALDRRLRERMLGLLSEVHARYRATMILVTHDYDEALALGERVAVLHEGRLLQLAPPEEVYRRPADARVAETTGAVSLVPARRDGHSVVFSWGSARSEFAPGAEAEVLVVLRPEDVEVGAGSAGRVLSARFRNGRWLADSEVQGCVVTGFSARRLDTGSSVSLRLAEPVWSVGR